MFMLYAYYLKNTKYYKQLNNLYFHLVTCNDINNLMRCWCSKRTTLILIYNHSIYLNLKLSLF